MACIISFTLIIAGCGSSKDEVVIGLNLELSGANQSYGTNIKKGAELALQEINENGGVFGKNLGFAEFDNKSTEVDASQGISKLVEQDGAVAVIGAATSGLTMAQLDFANQNGVVVLTPSGTNELITVNEDGSVNEFAFRGTFIDPFQGEVVANFASDELGVKTAAVYGDSASDYATGLGDAFKTTFEAAGGQVVAHEYYQAGDADFSATLTRLKEAQPEFIFVPGYYQETGLIVKQARDLGITVPMMGGDGWDSPEQVSLAGADAMNDTYMTAHYSAGNPEEKVQNFVSAFQAKYDESPDGFAGLGYDCVYFLKDAIERAGEEDEEGNLILDRAKIKDAMAATTNLDLVTGTVTVDELHNLVKAVTIVEFVDGEAKFKSVVNP
jgi:branched-chain amino acid transport system substrate-binding protein